MEFDLAHRLAAEGMTDARVLAAMMRVERPAFVPEAYRPLAHEDEALPIGHGQTISQPYIVAAMTSALGVRKGDRVLEIGTGSGYQAAVLVELGCEVFSIERVKDLAERAALALASKGYRVHLRAGDGSLGWQDEAPFDGIIVTAHAADVPRPLLTQLRDRGRLVMPLGSSERQSLYTVTRVGDDFSKREWLDVRFVPLVTGRAPSDG